MLDGNPVSEARWLDLGPMVVVCPEIALDAPLDRVALQATAFSNWSGPVFFLGGHDGGLELERPWQADYAHALELMLGAGAKRYLCGSNRADLVSGARMMIRDATFRDACSRGRGKVMLTGATRETHVASVAATLLGGGLFPIGSSTTIRESEIGRSARIPSRV